MNEPAQHRVGLTFPLVPESHPTSTNEHRGLLRKMTTSSVLVWQVEMGPRESYGRGPVSVNFQSPCWAWSHDWKSVSIAPWLGRKET